MTVNKAASTTNILAIGIYHRFGVVAAASRTYNLAVSLVLVVGVEYFPRFGLR
jgi:hypothetical protein